MSVPCSQAVFPNDDLRGEKPMSEIEKIMSDINAYERAIDDAEDALAAAEEELVEILEAECDNQ